MIELQLIVYILKININSIFNWIFIFNYLFLNKQSFLSNTVTNIHQLNNQVSTI